MISIADLRAWLGEPDEPSVNNLLEAMEARAVDMVESETERHFGTAETFVEHFVGSGNLVLVLNEAPSDLTSVEERTHVGDTWETITEGDDDGWELRDPQSPSGTSRLIRKGGRLWAWGREYRVTYEFGYAAGDEPGEIRQAVMDLVALKYRERTREGLRSETMGDYSYTTLADSMGKRDLNSVPGLSRALTRWRRTRRTLA